MGMTKQRQAERERRVHKAAIHRALVRQLQREEMKQELKESGENIEILTDEEDLNDITSTTTENTFYDICNEMNSASKTNDNEEPYSTATGSSGKSEKTGTA